MKKKQQSKLEKWSYYMTISLFVCLISDTFMYFHRKLIFLSITYHALRLRFRWKIYSMVLTFFPSQTILLYIYTCECQKKHSLCINNVITIKFKNVALKDGKEFTGKVIEKQKKNADFKKVQSSIKGWRNYAICYCYRINSSISITWICLSQIIVFFSWIICCCSKYLSS